MTEQEARNNTNSKIERLYQMAEDKLNEDTTEQDIDIARRMLIAGLDIATSATRNAIERAKRENEFY